MFYDRFLDLCRQKGVSPAAAAREMGFSNATTTQWSHGSLPSKASISKISSYFNVSAEYLKTGYDNESSNERYVFDDSDLIEPGTFQFVRFVNLCKQQGKMQSHLYDLVGLPSKAGSNLKRTKKVNPEILEVWAAELNTSAAYLNGETDDPSPVPAPAAPEQKEKLNALDGIELEKLSPARRALLEALDGMTEENIMKLVRIAQAVKMELPE